MEKENEYVNSFIGNCFVEEFVEGGKFFDVFHAHHEGMDIPVTLHIANGTGDSEELRKIAVASGQIIHPNVRLIHGASFGGSEPDHVVLERCNSRLSDSLLRKIDPSRAADCLKQVLDALESAHSRGIYHGNLSPGNIFFSKGEVRVGGFRNPEGFDLQSGALNDIYAVGGIIGEVLTAADSYDSAKILEEIAGDAATGFYFSAGEMRNDLVRIRNSYRTVVLVDGGKESARQNILSEIPKVLSGAGRYLVRMINYRTD